MAVSLEHLQDRFPIGAFLLHFEDQWDSITADVWVRSMVRPGVRLLSSLVFYHSPVSLNPQRQLLMRTAIQLLLDIEVMQEVPEDQCHQGFYSILFVTPVLGGMEGYIGPKKA